MPFLDKTDKKNTFLAILGVLLITAGVPFRPVMVAAVIFCGFAVIFINNPKTVICLMFTWLSFSTIFKFAMGDTSIYSNNVIINHISASGFYSLTTIKDIAYVLNEIPYNET